MKNIYLFNINIYIKCSLNKLIFRNGIQSFQIIEISSLDSVLIRMNLIETFHVIL